MIIRDRGGLLKMHPLPASPRSLFFPRGIFFEKQIGLDLIDAKTQNLKSIERQEQMYAEALKVFRGYSGHGDEEDD